MLEPEDVARAIVDAARQLPHAAIDEIVLGHVGRPLNG
jgi:NADP-dependent 3-hydroxy acid dehydrogenase YdfG